MNGAQKKGARATTVFPPARVHQNALFDAGIPATTFTTKNIAAEFDRLRRLGVTFRGEPKDMGLITAVPSCRMQTGTATRNHRSPVRWCFPGAQRPSCQAGTPSR